MLADVQAWLDQPETNFGWLMLSQAEQSNFSARRFASREDTHRAPLLTLGYFLVKIDRLAASNGVAQLQFTAYAGQPYTVQYSDSLAATNWLTLTNLPPLTAPTFVTVGDPLVAPQRCYRLLAP